MQRDLGVFHSFHRTLTLSLTEPKIVEYLSLTSGQILTLRIVDI